MLAHARRRPSDRAAARPTCVSRERRGGMAACRPRGPTPTWRPSLLLTSRTRASLTAR